MNVTLSVELSDGKPTWTARADVLGLAIAQASAPTAEGAYHFLAIELAEQARTGETTPDPVLA